MDYYVTGNVLLSLCLNFLFSVMNLLAEIYSQPEMVPKMLDTTALGETGEFDLNKATQEYKLSSSENPCGLTTTPRSWLFMRHSITSVRRSVIPTLVQVNLYYLLILVESGSLKNHHICFDLRISIGSTRFLSSRP
jgi:hypothetical protein